MTTRLTISTGMCLDAKGEESLYTQMGSNSSSAGFQAVYWKCLCVLFASSKRHNPTARHMLFTNTRAVPEIGGFDTQGFLDVLGVETVHLSFSYAPPLDFYDRWRNTFFILDIIKYFSEIATEGDQFVVNDSDCIYIKDASELSAAIARQHCLAYDVDYPVEKVINGHSRASLIGLYKELGLNIDKPAEHYGAEIFAVDSEALAKLMPELEAVWQEMLRRQAGGQTHFNTEEQLFSFLFSKLGYAPGTANPYISRIWTGFKMNTASQSNFDLTTWHLPNEKRYGISRLFEQVRKPNSAFWGVEPGAEFARYVSKFLAIPSPTPSKMFFDALDRTMAKLSPAGAA